VRGIEYSPAPMFDIDEAYKVQQFVASLIQQKLLKSAHDISEGGLIITLLEKGFNNNLGFDVSAENNAVRSDAFWFGEAQSRIVVSCGREQAAKIKANGITVTELGVVTGGEVNVNGRHWGSIEDWKNKYDNAIESYLD
jgi:phosphoribosylformylglycinamidine synthase subunit PurL